MEFFWAALGLVDNLPKRSYSLRLDASLALAWCFEDEQTPPILALLDRVAATGAIAPLLWPLEIGNALLMAERRRRLTPERRATLAGLLRDLPVMLDPETAHPAWAATTRLPERHGLTLYDAATLECAARRRLPLATLDRPLATVATTLGLETLGLA